MQGETVSRIRKPYRIVFDVITALLILLLLFAAFVGAFIGNVARVRRMADTTLFSACTVAAYATAKYDAATAVEKLKLDTEGMPVRVVTAVSSLNTLSPRQAVSACRRYRKLVSSLITSESVAESKVTVTPFSGGESIDCTLYTILPTHSQMTSFLKTLSENMETDGELFVLARAFYTALMMVAQDSTEVMAINSFENAWKALAGADDAHIAETAERLLRNNFPVAVYARGNRVIKLDTEFVFEDTAVRFTCASDGNLRGERRDSVALHVEDTDIALTNVCGFASGGFSGALTTSDGADTNVIPYGRKRAGEDGTGN